MCKQRGSAVLTFSVILLIVGSIFTFGLLSYVTYHDEGNRAERQIEAVWEDNENILANYSLKIKEMAQVPDKYADDLREVYSDVLAGRYGDDGSQAMFQWLQEQNPNFDSTMYNRLQQVMEAGRNEFRVAQTRLVDVKRQYETELGNAWSGFWLGMAGYPKIDLDDYDIITSSHAQNAFETGVDTGVEL